MAHDEPPSGQGKKYGRRAELGLEFACSADGCLRRFASIHARNQHIRLAHSSLRTSVKKDGGLFSVVDFVPWDAWGSGRQKRARDASDGPAKSRRRSTTARAQTGGEEAGEGDGEQNTQNTQNTQKTENAQGQGGKSGEVTEDLGPLKRLGKETVSSTAVSTHSNELSSVNSGSGRLLDPSSGHLSTPMSNPLFNPLSNQLSVHGSPANTYTHNPYRQTQSNFTHGLEIPPSTQHIPVSPQQRSHHSGAGSVRSRGSFSSIPGEHGEILRQHARSPPDPLVFSMLQQSPAWAAENKEQLRLDRPSGIPLQSPVAGGPRLPASVKIEPPGNEEFRQRTSPVMGYRGSNVPHFRGDVEDDGYPLEDGNMKRQMPMHAGSMQGRPYAPEHPVGAPRLPPNQIRRPSGPLSRDHPPVPLVNDPWPKRSLPPHPETHMGPPPHHMKRSPPTHYPPCEETRPHPPEYSPAMGGVQRHVPRRVLHSGLNDDGPEQFGSWADSGAPSRAMHHDGLEDPDRMCVRPRPRGPPVGHGSHHVRPGPYMGTARAPGSPRGEYADRFEYANDRPAHGYDGLRLPRVCPRPPAVHGSLGPARHPHHGPTRHHPGSTHCDSDYSDYYAPPKEDYDAYAQTRPGPPMRRSPSVHSRHTPMHDPPDYYDRSPSVHDGRRFLTRDTFCEPPPRGISQGGGYPVGRNPEPAFGPPRYRDMGQGTWEGERTGMHEDQRVMRNVGRNVGNAAGNVRHGAERITGPGDDYGYHDE